MSPILAVICLVAGFALLVKGADWFVSGASGLARRLGVSPLIIGLTIVAFGTSAPELAVSVTAALDAQTKLLSVTSSDRTSSTCWSLQV